MNSYYYLDSANTRRGPVDGTRLAAEGVTAQTLVWCVGMKEWTPASNVPELAALFQSYVQPEPSAMQQAPAQEETVAAAPAQPAQPQYQQPYQQAYQQPQYAQPQYGQPQYGQPYQQPYMQQAPMGNMPPMPDSYLVWAILSTICCCLPLGVVSIVYSSKVSGLYASGQYNEAVKASQSAKKWAIWSAVSSLIIGVLYFILVMLGVAAGINSSIY